MLARDEVLGAVDEAAEVGAHHHRDALAVLQGALLQGLAALAEGLGVVCQEVQEGRHLVAIQQSPLMSTITPSTMMPHFVRCTWRPNSPKK